MSQNEWILEALQKGPITPMDALRGCGCLRLAARVLDLRRKGHDILATKVTEHGKTFARYSLIRTFEQRLAAMKKEKKNGR